MTPGAASVAGTVQGDNGDPAAEALVTLAPVAAEYARVPGMYRTARTNGQGQFSFQNLRPAEYVVLGWEDVDINLVALPDFRERFEARAMKVKLGEKGRENIQVPVVPYSASEAEAAKFR